MKLIASVDDRDHQIELQRDDQALSVEIDGRSYSLTVHETRENGYLFFDTTKVYDCRVEPTPKDPDSFNVSLRGENYVVTIVKPKRLRTNQNSDQHDHGSAEIVAPMPGKVVRVLVETGTEVAKGTGIVIVEAMKMQNEMKSPRAGQVKSVNVKPGDTVNAGDVLAEVE